LKFSWDVFGRDEKHSGRGKPVLLETRLCFFYAESASRTGQEIFGAILGEAEMASNRQDTSSVRPEDHIGDKKLMPTIRPAQSVDKLFVDPQRHFLG
jgi:hypothetical protein